jgi:NitT/TauT family transport system substrate-binding protein
MSNSPTSSSGSGLTFLGKLFSFVLVLGLVGLGGYILLHKNKPAAPADVGQTAVTPAQPTAPDAGTGAPAALDTSDLADNPRSDAPKLVPAIAYVPQGNTIDIELSQYAGYAGLVVANGGLEPSDNSIFNTKYGFKVRLKLSEEESWNALNAGKMAASATTADVLAVYGRQFQVVVPAQISYSRGADGLIVRNEIRKVNDLKGKIVSAAQFTESDFFIRYLAHEAGLPIKMLPDMNTEPDSAALNLIFSKDGFGAGDFFVKALNADRRTVAGAMTWAPKTTEIPADSGGKARLLVSNKNLLIIADVLIVNKGFADKNPDKVAGLVDGLLAGNKAVTENPDANADVIGKAFKWNRTQTLAELQKVHLSNLPENLAFFQAGITQGGSFSSIYQSAVLAYGNDLVPNPVDSDYFVSLDALKKAETSGAYKNQVASITPLASGTAAAAETDPVLSKDIRFLFKPNSSDLDMTNSDNLKNLGAIKRILDVAPGSHIILIGHVDNSRIPELRNMGGQALVDKTALEAMKLSKDRASEVMKQLVAVEKVDPKRLETVGKGWMQPVSATDVDLNRRVEVQWFTLE